MQFYLWECFNKYRGQCGKINEDIMVNDTDNYERNAIYEDQEEVDKDSSLLYEMIQTINDELRYGSTLIQREDSFKFFFESLFGCSIDSIDDIEEFINGKESYMEIYYTIRDELVHQYDNYFGIKFEDPQEVDLNQLYMIYQVVYLQFVNFLCMYALGVWIKKGSKAIDELKINEIIADVVVGNYIANEDEFIVDNIGEALSLSDPGNIAYGYLFGIDINLPVLTDVAIDIDGFRARVKTEYSNQSIKSAFEYQFKKIIDNF
jgi:hypothetical protein